MYIYFMYIVLVAANICQSGLVICDTKIIPILKKEDFSNICHILSNRSCFQPSVSVLFYQGSLLTM